MSFFDTIFNSTIKGLVPPSGGGTTNFLRADGTWTTVVADLPANAVTTDTQQLDISGEKKFTNNLTSFGNGTAGASSILIMGAGTPAVIPGKKLLIHDTFNSYMQFGMQNLSGGDRASSDFVITADTGTDTTDYLDIGINNSGYSDPAYNVMLPLDAYFYSASSNLLLGTSSVGKNVNFFTGGTLNTNIRMSISDSNISTYVPILVPASVGIQISDGAPSGTSNMLYQVGGLLYFSGNGISCLAPNILDITYAATVNIDASNYSVGRLTLTGPCTINFIGGHDGQRFMLELKQDGTGGRIATLGSGISYGADITSYSGNTSLNKTDILGFIYNSDTSSFRLIAVAKGY